jgi:hypothetical protein
MHSRSLSLATALLAAACTNPPAQPPSSPASGARSASGEVAGRVLETIDASQYTYLRLQTRDGEAWAAVPIAKVAIGDEVAVASPMWMENFRSATLNRTWPKIAFGTLGTGSPRASTLPAGHPDLAAPDDVRPVKVAKVAGAQGRTVAEVWDQRTQLKDKRVAVRGKVVKATSGVMGKNWIHLRDGTGANQTSDLTVATADSAAIGDTVLATGTVRVDRDLGAGYHYDVLIEDARLEAR